MEIRRLAFSAIKIVVGSLGFQRGTTLLQPQVFGCGRRTCHMSSSTATLHDNSDRGPIVLGSKSSTRKTILEEMGFTPIVRWCNFSLRFQPSKKLSDTAFRTVVLWYHAAVFFLHLFLVLFKRAVRFQPHPSGSNISTRHGMVFARQRPRVRHLHMEIGNLRLVRIRYLFSRCCHVGQRVIMSCDVSNARFCRSETEQNGETCGRCTAPRLAGCCLSQTNNSCSRVAAHPRNAHPRHVRALAHAALCLFWYADISRRLWE